MCNRYCFNLKKSYFWKDIWHKWFWRMWGIKRTFKYILKDTIGG